MLFGRHIVELNGTNNTLVRSYAWVIDLSGSLSGAGGVGGLTWVTLHTASGPASGTHFTCYDGNGNVVSSVSATTGDVTARYEYGPFGELIRVSGPFANQNPFRFSTKRTNPTTDLVLYEYRVYQPSTGRWLNRDSINEFGFKILAGRTHRPFYKDEEKTFYGFVGNYPIIGIDADGLAIAIPPWAWPVAAGIGVGYCYDIAHCRAKVFDALCLAERDANRVAPDGSEHHSHPFLCRNTYRLDDDEVQEGQDADLLTHCIAACRLTQHPWPCFGPDNALEILQSRETRATVGSEIDWRNNNVGSGVGINIGPKGDCVQGCLDALNSGLLYTIVNGQPAPHPIQP